MTEALTGTVSLVGLLALSYGLVLLLSAPASLLKAVKYQWAGVALLCAAFAINTIVIADRWMVAGRPPFKTLYETLLFYPWCVGLVTLVLVALHRLFVLVPFAAAISLAGIGYALWRPDVEIINLPPALQSGWFVPHVVTYFVAYAGLFASCVLALLSLLAPIVPGRFRPADQKPAPASPGACRCANSGAKSASGRDFDAYAHKAVLFGFSALTLGLAMGAVWGKYAWGDYWSWDPKENWALVTWLAYLAYLHLRFVRGWGGRRAMVVLLCSFGAVVFTYLGMSLLPTASNSLHVYQ